VSDNSGEKPGWKEEVVTFLRSFLKTMYNRFSPGANIDAMNKLALENLQKLAGELAAKDVRTILVQWL
jgi:hypothetical protein